MKPFKKLSGLLVLSNKVKSLSDKLDLVSIEYQSICEAHEGIHTRHKRTELFPEKVDVITQLHKPILIGEKSGDTIEPYYIEWNGRYVNYDPGLCTPNKSGMTPDLVNPSWFTQTKLVIVRTGEEFTTAIDYKNFYLSNNLFSSFYKKDCVCFVDYKYLCCLLNSTLLQKFLRLRIAPRFGKLYVETKIKHLKILPIRKINFATPTDRRQQALQNAIVLYNQFQLDHDPDPLLVQINYHLDRQPEEADVIHDLLAHLAEQMIELNKQKQAEIKEFLQWLERFIGCPIDTLTNKSKIQNYLGDYYKKSAVIADTENDTGTPHLSFNDLIELLKKNRKKITIDPVARKEQQTLEEEYQASLKTLLPLKMQLMRCDRQGKRIQKYIFQ